MTDNDRGPRRSMVQRVVRRVARYSTLRAAERALLPSVRQIAKLPSAKVAGDVISNLHEMLDAARKVGESAASIRWLQAIRTSPARLPPSRTN